MLFNAVAGLALMPGIMAEKRVVHRQTAANFFHPLPYVIAVTLVDLCLGVVETTLFSSSQGLNDGPPAGPAVVRSTRPLTPSVLLGTLSEHAPLSRANRSGRENSRQLGLTRSGWDRAELYGERVARIDLY